MPSPEYTPCMSRHDSSDQNELELISQYFKQGYSNLEMLEFVKMHGVTISLSTLKRRLRSLGLSRRDTASDHELKDAIEKELGKSGCFVGYRKMWVRLGKKGVIAKRSMIMRCLRELDPDGVESRGKKRLRRRTYNSKRPNLIWHTDGHNKLKPYGFSVHGRIDGF